MLTDPPVIPMPAEAAKIVGDLARVGLPSGHEASLDALMAIYQLGFEIGRAHMQSEISSERNSRGGLPWFLRRQAV